MTETPPGTISLTDFSFRIKTTEYKGVEITTHRRSESSWQDEEGPRRPVLFFLGHKMVPRDYKQVIKEVNNSGRDIIIVHNKNVQHDYGPSRHHHSLTHEQERVAETTLDALTMLTPRMPKSVNFLTDSAGGVHGLLAALVNHERNHTDSLLHIGRAALVATAGFGTPLTKEDLRRRGLAHVIKEVTPRFPLTPASLIEVFLRGVEIGQWARRALHDAGHERKLSDYARAEILDLIKHLSEKGSPKIHLFFPEGDKIFPSEDVEKFIQQNQKVFDDLAASGNVKRTILHGMPHTALARHAEATKAALAWFDEEGTKGGK